MRSTLFAASIRTVPTSFHGMDGSAISGEKLSAAAVQQPTVFVCALWCPSCLPVGPKFRSTWSRDHQSQWPCAFARSQHFFGSHPGRVYYMFNVLLLALSNLSNTSITKQRLLYKLSLRLVSTTGTPCWQGRQRPSLTGLNGCSTQQPDWSVEPGSLIEACPNCVTPSYIGWTFFNVSSTNSDHNSPVSVEQGASVPYGLLHAYIRRSRRQHLRSANRRQLVVSRHRRSTFGHRAFSVAELIIRWTGTRFQTLSRTLFWVPTASDRLWRLISSQR